MKNKGRIRDHHALAVKAAANHFFGRLPYSTARIAKGSVYRMSYPCTGIALLTTVYRYGDKVKPEDKKRLTRFKNRFLKAMRHLGFRDVSIRFHIGSGMYASVMVPLSEPTRSDILAAAALALGLNVRNIKLSPLNVKGFRGIPKIMED